MNVLDYKTIVVLFEPMQGGNHLSNMLSTSLKLQNRVDVVDYNGYLLNQYQTAKTSHAHFTDLHNVGANDIDKLISSMRRDSLLPQIICGHIFETYYVIDYIKQHGPVGIINFESFNLKECVLNRMGMLDNKPSARSLLEWAHRSEVVGKTLGIDSQHMYSIDTNQLFEKDVTPLLEQINLDLGLELDLVFCMELHKLWANRIKLL